jgi:hypothetical protein
VPPSKHGPNRLDRYLAIHDTVIERYRDQGSISHTALDIDPGASGVIVMAGVVSCAHDTRVDVSEVLEVLSGNGRSAFVQTIDYSYSAILNGRGNIFRYCSPHGDDKAEHHVHHHGHRFDIFGGRRQKIEIIPDGEWPTLGKVIEELRGWCADHAHVLNSLFNAYKALAACGYDTNRCRIAASRNQT